MNEEGGTQHHQHVVIRYEPFDEQVWLKARADEKAKKIEKAMQNRHRNHARLMREEELRQRKVERAKEQKSEAYSWLLGRVAEGRLMLLKKSRLTGVQREARNLWFKEASTVSARRILDSMIATSSKT